jgi:hypothetical protein
MRRASCCFDLRAGCWLVYCQYRKGFYLQIKRHTNITLMVLIKMQLFFPSSLLILGFSKSHSRNPPLFYKQNPHHPFSRGHDVPSTRQHWLELGIVMLRGSRSTQSRTSSLRVLSIPPMAFEASGYRMKMFLYEAPRRAFCPGEKK